MSQDASVLPAGVFSGDATIAQINAAVKTAQTCAYGPVDPATNPGLWDVAPGFLWWDTSPTPDELKVRNAANDGWTTLLKLDGAAGPTLQAALDGKLALAGGTLTGFLTLHADPDAAMKAATKQYVDNTSRPGRVAFQLQGNATVANKLAQALMEAPASFLGLHLRADTAPVGASLTVQMTRLRTATADDSRSLSITAGNNETSTTFGTPMALLAGDRLRLDVVSVGSSVAGGNDLLVTARLGPP